MNKHSYSYEELIECAEGNLFGAGNAQLPLPGMLMIDRIVHIGQDGGKYGKGEVIAEMDIRQDLWFFQCHFAGDPVMPGCLGLDAMWQLVGFFLGWSGGKGRGRALGCAGVKFAGQVLPRHEKITYHIHMHRIIMRKLTLGIADATLSVDGEQIYEGKGVRVGLFVGEHAPEHRGQEEEDRLSRVTEENES